MPLPKKSPSRTRRLSSRRVLSFVDDSQQPATLHVAFGRRVKALRQKAKWTQAELAKEAGIDRSYIAQIEQGRRRLSLEIAYKLAKCLSFSLDEVLGDTRGRSHDVR